ncbi:fused MFS/spermidine synthase [Mesorhizobium sp. PAMC28654]|uniref:spermidine synthase n=1 Tax=Mesorhizobium sp. PAMC28654 TaxID=2880934 RepID=UPI001D0A6EDC|nr:fused MFS/spermidine synthase [Mesorhizobium sp. PAMC28654]UDL90667.1 fused MFS/spermidine synthase [Mesorhizobium sp. PAMC28654]
MIRIAKYHSDFGNIEVLRAKDTGSFIYRQGGCFQSECDQNGVSVVPYVHAIFGLLAQKQVTDVLMIGGGGGSLGTMLDRVGVRVTIVDINPQAFQIARRHFGLPRHVDCCVADGEEFLRAERYRYDAIVLDAYVGRRIPENLRTETFFRLARSRLKNSSGCFIGNIHARHDLDSLPDRVATNLSSAWSDVRLLDIRGIPDRNAIVMAGNVRELVPPRMLMPPVVGADDIAWDLNRLAFRPWHLPRQPAQSKVGF